MTFEKMAQELGPTTTDAAARMLARAMTIDRLLALPGVTQAIAKALPANVAQLQADEARRKLTGELASTLGRSHGLDIAYNVTDERDVTWPVVFMRGDIVLGKHATFDSAMGAIPGLRDVPLVHPARR